MTGGPERRQALAGLRAPIAVPHAGLRRGSRRSVSKRPHLLAARVLVDFERRMGHQRVRSTACSSSGSERWKEGQGGRVCGARS